MNRTYYWRCWLAGAASVTLMVGCSLPQMSGPKNFVDSIKQKNAIQTASYNAETADAPTKKVSDPISLKIRYAKWMEEIENYNEAQSTYSLVLQQRPEDVDAILGMARIAQAGGRPADAEQGYKKALALRPDSAPAKNALGQFYASKDQYQKAIPLLSDAMMADSTNKSYRYHLALALAKSGDASTALLHFQQAIGDAPAHFNVGMILAQQGQYRQAEQQLLKALSLSPQMERAQLALADVRQKTQTKQSYAGQRPQGQAIQPASHSLSSRQREQLRNQRPLSR